MLLISFQKLLNGKNMNPYAIEQKKENSFFGYSCQVCQRRLVMGPLGDLGDSPCSSLVCCVQHNLHTGFVPSLRWLLVLPCAFYCHLYLENDSTSLCHGDVTNPLRTAMHLFAGVPE